LKKARPSASSRRKGVLRFLRLPSGSFTSGGVAAFRRKPKEAEGSELVLKKARPSASFGKLHLWRLSEGSELVSVRRLPPEGRASFASFGKLHLWRLSEGSRRKRTCFEKSASFGFLRKASPLAASSGKLHLWRFLRKERAGVLNIFQKPQGFLCLLMVIEDHHEEGFL